jgi:hypothetical protein
MERAEKERAAVAAVLKQLQLAEAVAVSAPVAGAASADAAGEEHCQVLDPFPPASLSAPRYQNTMKQLWPTSNDYEQEEVCDWDPHLQAAVCLV